MARAPIDGNTLLWARKVSRIERNELASAAGVKPEQIESFESEDGRPTFRQLTLIAKKLDRPLGFFFAPAPAEPDVPETADFRGASHPDGLPSRLVREMRRAEQYREAMLELETEQAEGLILRPLTWKNLKQCASDVRSQLGLEEDFVPSESQSNQVFGFWRTLLESRRILVFQTTRIPLEVFRGVSIHHEDLPIILINGADSAFGRVFTLFHELGHLANRTSGLCALNEEFNEEALANGFAANVLIPEAAFRSHLRPAESPYTLASDLAQAFRVSTLAAAVRLRTLSVIDDETLAKVRTFSDEEWNKARDKNKDSGGSVPHWRLRYRDLGSSYIGTVARALEDNRVGMLDATYLLNARIPTIDQILNEYYRTGGTA